MTSSWSIRSFWTLSVVAAAALIVPREALAQPLDPEPSVDPEPPADPEPSTEPEPSAEPRAPIVPSEPSSIPPVDESDAPGSESGTLSGAVWSEDESEPMSEGRMLVSLYHSGFQWGLAPGVVFARGKAAFAAALRLGYGFDVGSVILVPGVRGAAYFTDPNVYLGMPTFKIVAPIDRFAPFVEGGIGVGSADDPAKLGVSLMGGGGFMIHFSRFAFGAEASYQVITGTRFKGFGVGPILAFGF